MATTTQDDRRPIADLISHAQVATLTTTTPGGRHPARPMALQEVELDGDRWFSADEDSAEVAHTTTSPEVGVSFADSEHHSWTSIAGQASVVHDHAEAEQLCTPVLEAWFPEGLQTPGPVLIEVEADTAEYGEGPTSTTSSALRSLRAAITGNPSQDPTTKRTVQL